MTYTIHDVEVSHWQAAPPRTESAGEVAILVRRQGRPLAFLMPGQGTDSSGGDASLRTEALARKVIQEAIREELAPGLQAPGHTFPSLTVAICTKDHPEILARCLRSIQEVVGQYLGSDDSPMGDIKAEVLVVDNAPSDDRARELVSSTPGVRYAREPMPGLDFARNRALQVATGELIAFLDDDVTVDRHWLDGLIEAWSEHPDAAAFTGLVLPYELETEAQIIFEQRGGFGRGFDKVRYGRVLPGNRLYPCGPGIFGSGCNMAFRRQVVLDLGGFDEALDTGRPLPGGGDLDMFYRIIRAGHALVYEPRFLIFHQHRREMPDLRRQYWSWGLGFMAFVAKAYRHDHNQRTKLRGVVAWWFQDLARQFARSILGRHPVPPSMLTAELWGGILGLLGEYGRSQRRVAKIRQQVQIETQTSSQ